MPGMMDWVRDDLTGKEKDLWTALTSANPAPAVRKLCLPEANLMFPDQDILTLEEEEDLEEVLKPPFHRFDHFEMEDLRVLYMGLMAGVVTYRIYATRGKKEYNFTASTTWSQGADGEWLLIAHQETVI